MFNNPYMQRSFNQQNMYEQIDNQINQLNHMKEQMKNSQQQPSINQTFQLAPNSYTMRYANTIEDVNKETVYFDTPFFSKDMSVLWIKSVSGNIKTYELSEIIPKDAKNEKIAELQRELQMADLKASQIAQNAFISQGFANEVDALYNRLATCPINTIPVYGNQRIFTCPGNNGCGCGFNTTSQFI